jgi:putative ABC transport system permease protein
MSDVPHFSISALGVLGIEGLRAIGRNKLRSALTALGITVGIGAVVCVVAIGTAGSQHAEAELQKLGNNLVWVEAGSRNIAGVRTGTHGTISLTLEDAEAIVREVPLILTMSPQVDGRILVAYQNRNWTSQYRGVSPEYMGIKRWALAAGRMFTPEQVEDSSSVVVIGKTLRENLFGSEDPLGKIVRINTQLFEVIGVLAPKGQSGTGQDQDDTFFLPYTSAQKKLRGRGVTWLDDVLCSAVSREAVNPAIDRVIALVRQRHQIQPTAEDDFNIRRPDEVIKAQIEASRSLTLLLVSVASISLLIGGIGIMNVMLVSVTERTREIGLRLAVGATPRAVQVQFLGEAVMLSTCGGLFGILIGVVSSLVLGRAFGWPVIMPAQALVIAPAFSIGVGVLFGFYPAWRAARLDPIEALRHE